MTQKTGADSPKPEDEGDAGFTFEELARRLPNQLAERKKMPPPDQGEGGDPVFIRAKKTTK